MNNLKPGKVKNLQIVVNVQKDKYERQHQGEIILETDWLYENKREQIRDNSKVPET